MKGKEEEEEEEASQQGVQAYTANLPYLVRYETLHMNSLPSITTKRHVGATDPDAEVVALRPEDLLATSHHVCNFCGQGFRRNQNLQLHMRVHNINWDLNRSGRPPPPRRRRAYICPVPTCVYHDRSRALSDLTGIKKHFHRKHGAKNLACPRCPKRYAVASDLKAHLKKHSLGDYRCECGSCFSRKNSYEAHRAFYCELPPPVDVLDNNFELPHMHEQVVYPDIDFTSQEEAPRYEAMAEQPNANVSDLDDDDPNAPSGQRPDRSVAMVPDDHDFLRSHPTCLTQLLKAGFGELFGASSSSSGIYHGGKGPGTSAPSGANGANGLMPSSVNFFGGSSSSQTNPQEY